MTDAPTGDDINDVAAWRRYAGKLRQDVGEAKRLASSAAELRAKVRETKAALKEARENNKRLERRLLGLQTSKQRDRNMLDIVERMLYEGDIPAAVHTLALRRESIEQAREDRRERGEYR